MFRRHFNATTAVAVVALVFAMAGGAYAAKKYLITNTKQISPKVLKALAGKAGSAGPAGPAGPAGKEGAAGKEGPVGKEGPAGLEGKAGANGVSAETKAFTGAKGTCAAGGIEVKSASPSVNVCNGKQGEPWTAGGTLPEGSSERGQWVISVDTGYAVTAISFPIPLAAALPEANVHVIGENEGSGESNPSPAITSGECSGTWQSPGAASKQLCVFVNPGGSAPSLGLVEDAETEGAGAGVSGAVFSDGGKSGLFLQKGSWAVTG